jgi:D-alanyl-D-alanine carboxypeptidase
MKPEHQGPPLGRNPNRVERWQTVNQSKPQTSSKANPKLTSGGRQTGVWHSSGEQDALKTGVWNPSRQNQVPPAGNLWVSLGIVVVFSLSSFTIFQSLLRPTFSNRVIGARVNPASSTASRDLPSAVSVQPGETDQVAASAVTFGEQSATGVTKPVQDQVSDSSTSDSSTIVETTPTNTLPANQIRLEQIDSIAESGGQPVLRFKDGSSLSIDASTLQQLPSDVRLRITYSRGRDGF